MTTGFDRAECYSCGARTWYLVRTRMYLHHSDATGADCPASGQHVPANFSDEDERKLAAAANARQGRIRSAIAFADFQDREIDRKFGHHAGSPGLGKR